MEFEGFLYPDDKGFTRIPHDFIEQVMPEVESLTELKIILYIARHTWGFQEYHMWKQFTLDELIHGRKRKDGGRMDKGTGLSDFGVKDGIAKAVKHGYIYVKVDDSDKGRIKKSYCLRMCRPPDECK